MFRVPVGLEDVSRYPYLFAELLESDRWTEEDLAKLAGRNLIRVFKQVEQVSVGNFYGWQKCTMIFLINRFAINLRVHKFTIIQSHQKTF
jgi:hypothetical protein